MDSATFLQSSSGGETSAAGASRYSVQTDHPLSSVTRRPSSSASPEPSNQRLPTSRVNVSPYRSAPSSSHSNAHSAHPVELHLHPPSSSVSPEKQPEREPSSSLTLAPRPTREVTPQSRSSGPFTREDSPLTPLPAGYTRTSSTAKDIYNGDDSDEVISSSEKGEEDASPLLPLSFSSVSAAGPLTAADSPQQVSSRVAGSTCNLSSTRAPLPSSSRPTSIPKAFPSRRTLAESESDDSDLASVASHLSDSDDELDTMERSIQPKRVLTEANGTTRVQATAKKAVTKLCAVVRSSLVDGRTPRSTSTYRPGQYEVKLSLEADSGPGSLVARTEAARFSSLIKATGRKQQALDRSRTYAQVSLSDDSDMSDPSTSTTRKGKERATYPTPSTDRRSSNSHSHSSGSTSSSSGDERTSADEQEVIQAPTTELLLGEEAANQLKELMGNDRATKRADKRTKRTHRSKGIGGWTGCWAWGSGRFKPSKVRLVEGEWDRINLGGLSEHPSFRLVTEAASAQDHAHSAVLLSCGVLETCLPFVSDKDKLLVSLIETAVITPDARLSRLAARAAVDLIANPPIDPGMLIRAVLSAFGSIGIKPDLLDPPYTPRSPERASVHASQGPVYPLDDLARDRATNVLVQVIDSAASHGLVSLAHAQRLLPLLAALSLEPDVSHTLESSLHAVLDSLVSVAQTIKEEICLCSAIVDFVWPYKLTFRHAVLMALPRTGPIASRVVAGCALAILGVPLDESAYGSVPPVDAVADLISQDSYRRPRPPLYIHPQMDHNELSAGLKVFAVVLLDLHRIYLRERRRIDEIQEETDEDERLLRTEVDQIPLLKPIADEIEAADRKILDSRGADLARTDVKAMFLNLLISVNHRERKYKAVYLRDREGEMRWLDGTSLEDRGQG